jgi:hypothetical protein
VKFSIEVRLKAAVVFNAEMRQMTSPVRRFRARRRPRRGFHSSRKVSSIRHDAGFDQRLDLLAENRARFFLW